MELNKTAPVRQIRNRGSFIAATIGIGKAHRVLVSSITCTAVMLHVPRLKDISFETAIMEPYRRRESSVEEALIEMYLVDVSVRRVENITETLWGSKVPTGTICATYCTLPKQGVR